MIVKCNWCGYSWEYAGKSYFYATCPKCFHKVKIRRSVPEKLFPEVIKEILKGLKDGRKRALHILVTFLWNAGYDEEEIRKIIKEWNERNKPPLRESYIKANLRWYFKEFKKRNLLPPNYDNEIFYIDIGLGKFVKKALKEGFRNPVAELIRRG